MHQVFFIFPDRTEVFNCGFIKVHMSSDDQKCCVLTFFPEYYVHLMNRILIALVCQIVFDMANCVLVFCAATCALLLKSPLRHVENRDNQSHCHYYISPQRRFIEGSTVTTCCSVSSHTVPRWQLAVVSFHTVPRWQLAVVSFHTVPPWQLAVVSSHTVPRWQLAVVSYNQLHLDFIQILECSILLCFPCCVRTIIAKGPFHFLVFDL